MASTTFNFENFTLENCIFRPSSSFLIYENFYQFWSNTPSKSVKQKFPKKKKFDCFDWWRTDPAPTWHTTSHCEMFYILQIETVGKWWFRQKSPNHESPPSSQSVNQDFCPEKIVSGAWNNCEGGCFSSFQESGGKNVREKMIANLWLAHDTRVGSRTSLFLFRSNWHSMRAD